MPQLAAMEFEAWLEEPWSEELPALGVGVESGGEIGAAGAEGDVTIQSGRGGTARPSGPGTDPEPLAAAWPDVHQENNDDLAALDLSIRRVEEYVSGGVLSGAPDGHGTTASWASSGQEVRRGGSLQPFEPIAVGDGPPAGTLPRAPNSEPGTPPPSPVRPASLSDSPAEASRRKRRRDEDDANVDAVFTAATQRPLTVDEVATLLTAPPASLQLTSRPEAGTQPWALHVECSREPRKFGRQTVRATPSPHSINEVQVNPADDLTDTGGRIPHRTSGATAGERRGPLSCARPTRACRRSPGATASCAAAPKGPRCVSMSMPFRA